MLVPGIINYVRLGVLKRRRENKCRGWKSRRVTAKVRLAT